MDRNNEMVTLRATDQIMQLNGIPVVVNGRVSILRGNMALAGVEESRITGVAPARIGHNGFRIRCYALAIVMFLLGVLLAFVSPARAAEPVMTKAGVDLLAKFEVGGRSAYERLYSRPICPACLSTASGVTIGIGYDLRHNDPQQIMLDWRKHPQRFYLPQASGIGGERAVALAKSMRNVNTSWDLALEVLQESTLPRYAEIARRSFGPGFDRASATVRDALISVVYNRGGSTVGPARREFREIRDKCLPADRPACTAGEIRAMVRLWRGTSIEGGMTRRRYAEAAHAER